MKDLLNKALKPENREAVLIGTAVGVGVVTAVVATKVATLGVAGKIIVGTALGAGAGYIAKKQLEQGVLDNAIANFSNYLNNKK